MTTKAILQHARSLVECGWYQGGLTDGHGNYCIKAAIGLASGFYVNLRGDVAMADGADIHSITVRDTRALDAVKKHLPEPFQSIPFFNDHPETTHTDVLAVLDKAIAAC